MGRDWKPESTHVVILGLGLNEWAEPANPSWCRNETLRQFFEAQGVPESQILFLDDQSGRPDKMRTALPEFLGQSAEDGILFFYYAGHGDYDQEEEDFYFCYPTGDDAVYAGELFDLIDAHFGGSQAVILADCCQSGCLAREAEGRTEGPAYGVLTSATEEVSSTGNWTFTDCVLAGLRGESGLDEDENGTISFQELCDYVLAKMREVENQPADYQASPSFDSSFRLAVVR